MGLHKLQRFGYRTAMSTVQEIEAAVQRLSPEELAQLRAWLEDYCEERLELTAEEVGKLNAWADKERASGCTRVSESPAAYAAQARAKRTRRGKSQ